MCVRALGLLLALLMAQGRCLQGHQLSCGDARLQRGRPGPKADVGTWAGLGQIQGSKHDRFLIARNVQAKGKKSLVLL